jgi:hypothetical protein
MGDDSAAMEDLDKAIHANIADATEFVNSEATAPEKSASACTWTLPEMDGLVQRFPNDYRAYLFRGLYDRARKGTVLSTWHPFGTPLKTETLNSPTRQG